MFEGLHQTAGGRQTRQPTHPWCGLGKWMEDVWSEETSAVFRAVAVASARVLPEPLRARATVSLASVQPMHI